MLDTANTSGILSKFRVVETLVFSGDRAPIVLDPEVFTRPTSWQVGASIRYRAEWKNDPAAAYSWSWFDHHPNLIAICYHVEKLS
jgi:hypothetical protein